MSIFDRFSLAGHVGVVPGAGRGIGEGILLPVPASIQIEHRPAALHHHFPTKVDLGLALIDRFSNAVLDYLNSLNESTPNHLDRLSAYVAVYDGALDENKMCLCGLMAAE